jgi:hypothetical protein
MQWIKLFLPLLLISSLNAYLDLQQLEQLGFTVLDQVFTPEEIQQISSQFIPLKEKAFHIIETTPLQERVFSENNQETRSSYWKTEDALILQAGKGRYDFYQGFKEGIFASPTIVNNPILQELMGQLLGDEFTNYSGIIYSAEESEDQYWHRDTNTLSNKNSSGEKLVGLDDFYFTVLIPITVPFTLENGATEFLVGSHRLSSSKFGQCTTSQVEVPLGSALVFNGKINHRGKANHSSQARPALYLVYHKKWYNDQYRKGVN